MIALGTIVVGLNRTIGASFHRRRAPVATPFPFHDCGSESAPGAAAQMRTTFYSLILFLVMVACGDEAKITPAAPDINISLDPPSVLMPPGETTALTVAMQGSVAGPWSLSVTGLPLGVVGVFDRATLAPDEVATLTLSADAAAPNATVTSTVTVTYGSASTSAPVRDGTVRRRGWRRTQRRRSRARGRYRGWRRRDGRRCRWRWRWQRRRSQRGWWQRWRQLRHMPGLRRA
jgi:hypothetical protein